MKIHQSAAALMFDFDYMTLSFRRKDKFCHKAVKFASMRDGFSTSETEKGTHQHNEISKAIETVFCGKREGSIEMTEQVNNAIAYLEYAGVKAGEQELFCEEYMTSDNIEIAGSLDCLILFNDYFLISDWKSGAAGEWNPYIKDIQGIWYLALAFETFPEFDKGFFQFVPTGVENMMELLKEKEKFYAMEITRKQYEAIKPELISVIKDVHDVIKKENCFDLDLCGKCRYFHKCEHGIQENNKLVSVLPKEINEEAVISNLGELYAKALAIKPVMKFIEDKAKEIARNGGLALPGGFKFEQINGKSETVKNYPQMGRDILTASTVDGKPVINDLYRCLNTKKAKQYMKEKGAKFTDGVFKKRKYSPCVIRNDKGEIVQSDDYLKKILLKK